MNVLQPVIAHKITLCWVTLLCLNFFECSSSESRDQFQVEPHSAEWESLIFWISNAFSIFGMACRQHSDYYCLDAYHTQNPYNSSQSRDLPPALEPMAAHTWFHILIEPKWIAINMIDYYDTGACCADQVKKYLIYGLHNKEWNPDEYMDKLANYEDENRTLNYISATYFAPVCQNIILEIGFGPGNLKRSHHITVKEGEPYLLAGMEMGGLGIAHVESKSFSYSNITQELTFHWFKHNIMCRDNPWICEEEKETSNKGNKGKECHEEKGGAGGSSGASGSGSKSNTNSGKKNHNRGNKKSQRKKTTG
ncbi:uncharacterized protein LOC134842723 [Symsagittifera roscoffensis]|uniref:uncharacterized protein LOC134842723 n=1 Tax=Symsagittifera roscoffensis TaxID=84072 RepID=UPI00307CC719